MNDATKEALINTLVIITTTMTVTMTSYLTIKLCSKTYGPIEINTKK